MILKDVILQSAVTYHPRIIEWRRAIHQHPELSFEEYQTAAYISSLLTHLGISHKTGIAGTGIIAFIEGQKEGLHRCIGLRADMDALPISEANEVVYKSKNEGVMHACGHDAHTASLLGTAAILQSLKEYFSGKVILIFQPGEETLPGGASLMINEGLLDTYAPEIMLAQHVFPDLPAGEVGFRPGLYMASSDEIYITIQGKGGHGGLPHLAIDPILIASHVVVSLQQVVSRHCPPTIPSVLTIGDFRGMGATNIIPGEVKMKGTFRTMDEDWRKKAHRLIWEITEGITLSMGGMAGIEIKEGYPYLHNDETLTRRMQEFSSDYLGSDSVKPLDVRMTAEDFAWFSQKVPSCLYRFGIASPSKKASPVHTPTFDIDENSLLTSSGLMAYLAICELNRSVPLE